MVYSNSQAEYEGSIPFARSSGKLPLPSRDHHFCGGRDFYCPRFSLTSISSPEPIGQLPLPSRELHRVRFEAFLPAFCINIHFVTLPKGFSQELCGSWDFSFSGKRLLFSRFAHNLKKRTAKGEKQAPLGSRFPPFFLPIFPGAYTFFRSAASAMHWLAASSAWTTR